METYLYILKEPDSGDTRYVGITIVPKARLRAHVMCNDGTAKKIEWIERLKTQDQEPVMELICCGDRSVIADMEATIVKRLGGNLLNCSRRVRRAKSSGSKSKYTRIRSMRLLPEMDEAWERYEQATGIKFSHMAQIVLANMLGIKHDIRPMLKGFTTK